MTTNGLNIRILDVNHADLFEPGAEGVRIALADLTYDGRDHAQAMRQRAKRLAGAKTSRVVARWDWCVANTLTGFDGGGPARQTHLIAQQGRLRTLTFTEWERLQGFPDGWTDGIPPGDLRRNKVLIRAGRYTVLGNSMHVGMAEWLGARLMKENAHVTQLHPAH
jgi:site-specific DNA-cytosine methylase